MKQYLTKKLLKINLSAKTAALIFFIFFLNCSVLFADQTYKVQKGDTLYSISRKFQITVGELRAANNLSENDVLKADQKLIIPAADIGTAAALASTGTVGNAKNESTSVYMVQKGDTLYGIARQNGMTVPELLALNNFDSDYVLKAGQKLKVRTTSKERENAEKTVVKNQTQNNAPKPSSEAKKPASDSSKQTAPKTEEIPDTRTYGITINSDSTTVWPVKNPKVTTVKGKVSGVQLICDKESVVSCIHEGTVMYVGTYRGFGQVLFVQSKTGLIYAYTGMGSVSVKKGDYVVSGASLGTVGVDSITGKSQITFMVFQNGQPVDPAKAPRN